MKGQEGDPCASSRSYLLFSRRAQRRTIDYKVQQELRAALAKPTKMVFHVGSMFTMQGVLSTAERVLCDHVFSDSGDVFPIIL